MGNEWAILAVLVFAGLAIVFFWYVGRRSLSNEQALLLFQQQREHLKTEFFQAASSSGKPRGLRWKSCEWADHVEFARERPSGRLAAVVSVTISFEAIEGSDMEDLPAVGNLRNASAVFFFDSGSWHTTGKTVFNLNPDEVLSHFTQYERVES